MLEIALQGTYLQFENRPLLRFLPLTVICPSRTPLLSLSLLYKAWMRHRNLGAGQRRRQRQRKRHLKILTLFNLCYFSSFSTRSTSTETANYLGTNLIGVALKLRKKMIKLPSFCSRSRQNLESGHFTLLFCRGRQRNVPKCKTYVQSDCFSSLNQTYCFAALALSSPSSLLKLPITSDK